MTKEEMAKKVKEQIIADQSRLYCSLRLNFDSYNSERRPTMTKAEIAKRIKDCENELAELRKELNKSEYGGKRWRPKKGERVFFFNIYGRSFVDEWRDGISDDELYALGNIFPSQKAADFEVERRRVIAELSDFAEGDDAVWDGNQCHYSLWYDYIADRVDWNVDQCYKRGNLYFPSKEAALAAIEAVGEDRIKKYYLGVRE